MRKNERNKVRRVGWVSGIGYAIAAALIIYPNFRTWFPKVPPGYVIEQSDAGLYRVCMEIRGEVWPVFDIPETASLNSAIVWAQAHERANRPAGEWKQVRP